MNFRHMRRNAGPITALAGLVLIGGLVGLSAPRSSTSTPKAAASASSADSTATLAISPTATTKAPKHTISPLIAGATPADTPSPTTAIPTVSPTATPVLPTPTDTPIPTPAWHLVGTFSGTGPSTVISLTGVTGTQQNIRVDWTCQDPSVEWQIGFGIAPTGGNLAGAEGKWCGGAPTGNQGSTSGSMIFNADTHTDGTAWTISMVDNADAGGPWTATIYVWY